MMNITTKRGDGGETFLGKRRISKTSDEIAFLGKLDKLTSYLGVASYNCPEEKETLERMQEICYEIMSCIHEERDCSPKTLEDVERHLSDIELEEFIKPTGRSAHIHFARTLCREAEVLAFKVLGPSNIAKALNRMSDVIFISAYRVGKEEGIGFFRRKD